MENNYVQFTKEMKKDYVILTPNMLPMHFELILQVMRNYGYNMELLRSEGPHIAEKGLKYVHNDTCYPALLVIGQFLDAIESGRYDPHKVALILFQTGGGCRASNYISLLRKALQKAGYGYVPVISFSVAGIEKHPGWNLNVPKLHRMLYGVLYGDLLMSLVNQCKPYELNKGESQALADKWTVELANEMAKTKVLSYPKIKENYRLILRDFKQIPVNRVPKPKVGIVGEIFVKYSPLGNNNLEDFLVREGAEAVIPGLVDFILYTVYNNMEDARLYGVRKLQAKIYGLAYKFLNKKVRDLIDITKEESDFTPPTPFPHTATLVEGCIHHGTKMGEGWLLTAEMLELADSGVNNIVCTQPFGCLPNHICGKGMMKPIKEKIPAVNIVAIDYDPGATQVNQENRIKLMLANAREAMEQKPLEKETQAAHEPVAVP
ncbi:MAG: 2-hydroxyglutaryl-CoA dehydratase [Ruminococcaceae bacterium]|nr:2-hydroxyglutaryl-CoA dehydratase [Oscillospiraceae bacterium]